MAVFCACLLQLHLGWLLGCSHAVSVYFLSALQVFLGLNKKLSSNNKSKKKKGLFYCSKHVGKNNLKFESLGVIMVFLAAEKILEFVMLNF